jgi:phosphohistidine phosphatase
MLTLYLLRHAKSSWDDSSLQDFDRPLADRGEKAAARMGAYIESQGLVPELILCSSAARTRQTLDLILPLLSTKPSVEYETGLYLATSSQLLARIRKVGSAVRKLMLVGHDPGMHGLALDLSGTGRKDDLQRLASKFPTAGLAVITFDSRAWSKVQPASGHLQRFVTPKTLP